SFVGYGDQQLLVSFTKGALLSAPLCLLPCLNKLPRQGRAMPVAPKPFTLLAARTKTRGKACGYGFRPYRATRRCPSSRKLGAAMAVRCQWTCSGLERLGYRYYSPISDRARAILGAPGQ